VARLPNGQRRPSAQGSPVAPRSRRYLAIGALLGYTIDCAPRTVSCCRVTEHAVTISQSLLIMHTGRPGDMI
jgi:hypothetical protein